MDWLRRNWPDLAIGIALIAVIAGIVATLITGGSFFPIGGGTTGPAPTPDPVVSTPATPDPAVPDPDPVGPVDPAEPVDPDDPVAVDPDDTPAPDEGGIAVLTPDGEDLPEIPDAVDTPVDPDPVAGPPAVVVTPVSPDPVPDPTPVVPDEPQVAVTPTPSPDEPVVSTPAGALPAASADEQAPYRVSAGAFGNADNAARLQQTLEQAGFPVFIGTQGNLTIVLVGPYETEAAAQEVSTRISAGGFGVQPAIYVFRPDATDAPAAVSTPAPAAPVVPASPAEPVSPQEPASPQEPVEDSPEPVDAPVTTPAPAPTTPAAPAAPQAVDATTPIATSSTGRSLQVGAYADLASAAPLRERLMSLGLVAFEVREDGLVKLLVGPFDEANLALARARLAQQGIESFPR